jgi:hypothetical protein
MTIIARVNEMQDPHITERFSMNKSVGRGEAIMQIGTAAKLYIDNKIALAVLAKAYEICEPKPIKFSKDQIHYVDDKWNFVMCSPQVHVRLDAHTLIKGCTWMTHHTKFENKLVTFNLKDPTHLAEYTFDEVASTNPDVGVEYELRLKINLDDAVGELYTFQV